MSSPRVACVSPLIWNPLFVLRSKPLFVHVLVQAVRLAYEHKLARDLPSGPMALSLSHQPAQLSYLRSQVPCPLPGAQVPSQASASPLAVPEIMQSAHELSVTRHAPASHVTMVIVPPSNAVSLAL
jgi:hypothetical protein